MKKPCKKAVRLWLRYDELCDDFDVFEVEEHAADNDRASRTVGESRASRMLSVCPSHCRRLFGKDIPTDRPFCIEVRRVNAKGAK